MRHGWRRSFDLENVINSVDVFCQHWLIFCVHIERCTVSIGSCMSPPAASSSPVYQRCGSKWCAFPWTSSLVFSLTIHYIIQGLEHNFTCPSFLNCSLLSTFFSATLNFTGFTISDGLNQCDRSTLSCLGRGFHIAKVTKEKWWPTKENWPHEMLTIKQRGRQRKQPGRKNKCWQCMFLQTTDMLKVCRLYFVSICLIFNLDTKITW